MARFFSHGHARRRSIPVITSMRWSPAGLVSTLRSNLRLNRLMLIAAHHANARNSREGGSGVALTNDLLARLNHFAPEGAKRERYWPRNPQSMSSELHLA